MNVTSAHRLPNGLLVLIREVHHAPIATCWVWYRVGSRNDPPSAVGLSHLVEHLLFQTTSHHTIGEMKRLVARYGGTSSGFTAPDYSACFATLPADNIHVALQLMAETMSHERFDPRVIEREQAIIQVECERAANASTWWLSNAVFTTAFQAHPYRYRVLSAASDLAVITADDVAHHYQTYYTADNAVVVVVGDVNTTLVMAQIERAFAPLACGSVRRPRVGVEPAQRAERRVVVHRPSQVGYVQIGYHAPHCRHRDFVPLLLLDAILSGAKAVSFSNGVTTYHSMRLAQAVVEPGRATHAHSHYYATIDPRLFELDATVQDGQKTSDVERALLDVVARIQQDGVRAADVTRARKQLRAQIAYAGERMMSHAWLLGMWAMLDRYTRAGTLLDEVDAVSAADIQRVAQTYLVAQQRTVGHLLAAARSSAQDAE